MFKKLRIYSGREGWILEGSHIVGEKEMQLFKRGVYSGRKEYILGGSHIYI